MARVTRRAAAYLVLFRVRQAAREMEEGRQGAAQESTRRAGQYARVLATMAPGMEGAARSVDALLQDALDAGDDGAEVFLDLALLEAQALA